MLRIISLILLFNLRENINSRDRSVRHYRLSRSCTAQSNVNKVTEEVRELDISCRIENETGL